MSMLLQCGASLTRSSMRTLNYRRTAAVLLPIRVGAPSNNSGVLLPSPWHQSHRGHKDFGHKPIKTPLFTKLWHGFLAVSLLAVSINWEK